MTREGYEPLSWQHLREFPGGAWDQLNDAQLRFLPMIGYAVRAADGRLVGAGGVIWFGRRAEGMFAITEEFRADLNRSRWVHRAALEVLSLAHRIAPVIHARVDEKIPSARRWMQRLGFSPPADGGEYWEHVVHSANVGSGRLVHSVESADNHVGSDAGERGRVGLRRHQGR